MNSPTLTAMLNTEMSRQERDYIDETLKACADSLDIKSYMVIQESTFDEIKDKVDFQVERNPMWELAAMPLNLSFLGSERWVAVLVEYNENLNI